MNDSFQTNVFVRFPPEAIACACLHLSSRILRVPLPTEPMWYSVFNVETETIESICKSILMLYTRKTLNLEELKSKVEIAQKNLEAEKLRLKQQQLMLNNADNNSPSQSQDTLHNKFITIDSGTNSPQDSNSAISINKTMELKSVIGKLVKDRMANNLQITSDIDKQNDSERSSESSSSSFKLQKSPPITENQAKMSKNIENINIDLNNVNKRSYESSNGHSKKDVDYDDNSIDSYNTKLRKIEKNDKEYYNSDKRYDKSPVTKSYITTTQSYNKHESYRNNDDVRPRYKRSRSPQPMSPKYHHHDDYDINEQYYRSSKDKYNYQHQQQYHRKNIDYDRTYEHRSSSSTSSSLNRNRDYRNRPYDYVQDNRNNRNRRPEQEQHDHYRSIDRYSHHHKSSKY